MENNGILKNSQIIVLGLCIAAATIFSSFILSSALILELRMRSSSTG